MDCLRNSLSLARIWQSKSYACTLGRSRSITSQVLGCNIALDIHQVLKLSDEAPQKEKEYQNEIYRAIYRSFVSTCIRFAISCN